MLLSPPNGRSLQAEVRLTAGASSSPANSKHWFTTSFLQALVYNILPSTTAVFSYAIGPRKLSANEQLFFVFFCWCSNSSTFVTNSSNYISDCFITDHAAYASSKPKSFQSRRNCLFTRGGCASMKILYRVFCVFSPTYVFAPFLP